MRKIIGTVLLSAVCPIVLASTSNTFEPQLGGYQSGPQHIKNSALYPDQTQTDNQNQEGLNLDSSELD